MTATPADAGVQAVLLDIEGTTTPIAFVSEVLFPYARTHLRPHIEQHANSADYQALLMQLSEERASDREAGENVPPWFDSPSDRRIDSIGSYVEWLMARDRKSTALKELQGRIWEEGYRRGDLVGQVFPDVPAALERWRARDLPIGIFSSGSVLAQRLLFRYSAAGDLTRFIASYFDTTSGPKHDPVSYQRIATAMARPAGAILFASDVVRELDAARAAGMQTRLSIRPGNALPPSAHGHFVIRTCDEMLGGVQ